TSDERGSTSSLRAASWGRSRLVAAVAFQRARSTRTSSGSKPTPKPRRADAGWTSTRRCPENRAMTGSGPPPHDEIARGIATLIEPGQVTELRALGVSVADFRRPHTVSGYFDDAEALARSARAL